MPIIGHSTSNAREIDWSRSPIIGNGARSDSAKLHCVTRSSVLTPTTLAPASAISL